MCTQWSTRKSSWFQRRRRSLQLKTEQKTHVWDALDDSLRANAVRDVHVVRGFVASQPLGLKQLEMLVLFGTGTGTLPHLFVKPHAQTRATS